MPALAPWAHSMKSAVRLPLLQAIFIKHTRAFFLKTLVKNQQQEVYCLLTEGGIHISGWLAKQDMY